MSERKCPACGATVQENTAKCPDCGLEGLNLRFLSKAGYEKWVKEVLEPHRAALLPKVFAGEEHGLILTPQGKLYGIGRNVAGQIDEKGSNGYEQPYLMAVDVISAAAGSHYSAYVTRDGKVHLRGKGELAERFPGFSDAVKVYGDTKDSFWIQTRDGKLFGFGYNQFIPEESRVWETLAPETCVVRYGEYTYSESEGPIDSGSFTEDKERDDLKGRLEGTKTYREAVNRFGGENVKLELRVSRIEKEKVPEEGWVERDFYGTWYKWKKYTSAERYTYIPEIKVFNREIDEPVLCSECKWENPSIHWKESRPALVSDCADWKDIPGMKKVAHSSAHGWICLLEDGTIETEKYGKLDWQKELVTDIGFSGKYFYGSQFVMLTSGNGDILWCTAFYKLLSGEMHVCRLPGDE